MLVRMKRIRSNVQGSNFFSPYYPPKRCQAYFDSLLKCIFDKPGSKQWNFTINPNPKTIAPPGYKPFSSLTDKQIFNHFRQNIKSLILHKGILPFVREYLIFFEYGDKNGKPHCNLVLHLDPDTPDKHRFFILQRLKIYGTSSHTINFKNQKETFKSQDIYNQKDVSYMLSLCIKPVYNVNKYTKTYTTLLESIKNRRIEYSYYPYTVCEKNRSPGTGHYFVNSKSQYVIIGIKKNI